MTEARARIIWGEAAASVRSYLTSKGLPDSEADAKIQEFTSERIAEIRSIGIRKTVVGAALTLGMGGFFYFDFKHPNFITGMVAAKGGAEIIAFAGIYGFWQLVNGIVYLLRPQSEGESIPDIPE
jgi:hypothetical protein